ncbi:MAG: hypothetical protein ACC653_02455 [Gammaproteobacteria bacterium]
MINFKKIYFSSSILSILLVVSACETTVAQNEVPVEVTTITTCSEPRPQICTNEYKPVCATLDDGKQETYATGCTACADTFVVSYQKDVCK